uniref:SD-repeat containing protein B domain-containing protein n=1 Tax=Strigamia maritima TaxID=126957 RepID=T1IP66_STRMM
MKHLVITLNILIICVLRNFVSSDNILGCGGFVKSSVPINFSLVEIKLYTKQGSLKYQTDCAPNNGYYLIPVYDKGEFVLKIEAPPRWNFEPKQVALIIDGQNDVCSQGKDTNFYFEGFTINGKVVSREHTSGPEGISVSLKTDKILQRTSTSKDGRYSFSKVLPGSYLLIAQHSTLEFDKSEIKIEINDKSKDIQKDLVISGYDVRGEVSSDGEPIKGVNFLLFSKKTITDVRGCIKKPVEGFTGSKLGPVLCYMESQEDGKFLFKFLTPGEYTIVPFYKGENIHFDVTPAMLTFTLGHANLVLAEKFKLQGFNVVGHVLAAPGGPPVAGARIWIDDKQETETKNDGSFTIVNMKAAIYKVVVVKENIVFDPMTVKITPSAPQLGPIIARAFKVCGKLHVTRLPTGLDLNALRLVSIESTSDPKTHPTTARTNDKGEYCAELSRGKYKVRPIIAEPELNAGLRFIPESKNLVVQDKFVTDVNFNQFLAKLSGEVKCKKSCRGAVVTLAPKLKGIVETNSFTLLDKKFNFDSVLPGDYEIGIVKEEWCWLKNKLQINVATRDVNKLEFIQSGYVMNVVSSHETVLNYALNEEKNTFKAKKGPNSLCVAQDGVYELTATGCHRFGNEKIIFDTNKLAVVVLQATHHLLSGNIKTNNQVKDIEIEVNISSPTGDLKNSTFMNKFKMDASKPNLFKYEFTLWLEPEDIVRIKPHSGLLLFSPATQTITAKDKCMEDFLTFEGRMGFFINGKILPPLEGVEIYMKDKLITETDKTGKYSIGPLLDNGEKYAVEARKPGYVLTLQKEFDFEAFKLAEIVVKVVDEKNDGIDGVLLSLSGGLDYRQNSLTEKNGELAFVNLEPGQYFLRPVLKEYSFTPPSTILDLSEGKTVNIGLKAIRIAFSCYGNITSLVGEPEPGVVVEAVGINMCKELQEEATTESEGIYRIRGLKPDCQYQVRVKNKQDPQHNLEHATPIAKTIKVQNSDIKGIDMIVFRRPAHMEISGNVVTDNEFLTTLQVKLLRDESTVHTIALTQSTFFQMPSVPFDGRSYLLRLETSLQHSSYSYSLPQVTLKANTSYQHITFKFSPVFKGSESDLHQGSHYAFPLTVLAVIIGLMYKQILPLSSLGAEFVHNVRNPAVNSSRESFGVE